MTFLTTFALPGSCESPWMPHVNAMTFMLSNGLCLLGTVAPPETTTAPAVKPLEDTASDWMVGLLAVGICVLVVLAVRRILRPGKLALRSTPGRSNSLSIIHVIGLLALSHLLMGLAGAINDVRWELLGWAGASGIWLGSSLGVASVTFRFGLSRGLGLNMRHWVYDTLRGVLAWLAVLPVCMGLLLLTVSMLQWVMGPEEVKELIQDHPLFTVLEELPRVWLAVPVIIAVVLAPLSEEVFFRGLVQSMLRRYVRNPWGAIVITSLFFALMHVSTPQAIPPLFVLSVVIGYNYERCGRLYPGILIHMLFNAVFMLSRLSRT